MNISESVRLQDNSVGQKISLGNTGSHLAEIWRGGMNPNMLVKLLMLHTRYPNPGLSLPPLRATIDYLEIVKVENILDGFLDENEEEADGFQAVSNALLEAPNAIAHLVPHVILPYETSLLAYPHHVIERVVDLTMQPALLHHVFSRGQAPLTPPPAIPFRQMFPQTPVTLNRLEDFFADYPRDFEVIARALKRRFADGLSAESLDSVNTFMSSKLGIAVRVEEGSLVTPHALDYAFQMAGCNAECWCGIPRIGHTGVGGDYGEMRGAAYSVEVNRVLSNLPPRNS